MNIARVTVVCVLVCAGSLTSWAASRGEATTQLLQGMILEIEQQTVNELLDTFEQAEAALQARDLDGIMALYSEEYAYHGLKKADIRTIWRQLFDHYTELESQHTFSAIHRVGPAAKLTAEITCTGAIWGTSKETTLRTPIDSWHEEIHYLRKETGRWTIIGHAGGDHSPPLQFGIAPHPLF
jgi:ketosteroid isomerase-like protein